MQGQDQTEIKQTLEEQAENIETAPVQPVPDKTEDASPVEEAMPVAQELELHAEEEQRAIPAGFDWLALGAALLIAAFFALTARFNSLPAPSFVPAAALSATGCGLLVTALRKLRHRPGVGLLEASLAGLCLALFQFAITFTYPDVFTFATTVPESGHAFLITWGLVGLFAVVLSLAGAALGHLAFAPLRPLPARTPQQTEAEEREEEEEEHVETEEADAKSEQVETAEETGPDQENEEVEEAEEALSPETQRPRSLVSYAITVLLLGLLPMMIGYVFAAVYDFVLGAIHVDQISPAFYPTLSLLAGLLPWRLPVLINLANANGSFIVFTLLWRVPDSILGNPSTFDVQALEPFVFNAAALALFLIALHRHKDREGKLHGAPWGLFIGLEALLGLTIILPSNLWLLRGLEGVLQFQGQVVQLPTIFLLNPALFILNLLTGPLFCVLAGLVVRRQHQLWTTPRRETPQHVN